MSGTTTQPLTPEERAKAIAMFRNYAPARQSRQLARAYLEREEG